MRITRKISIAILGMFLIWGIAGCGKEEASVKPEQTVDSEEIVSTAAETESNTAEESEAIESESEENMITAGWQWIDDRCYYYAESGDYLRDTTTPDGYTVNADGVWVVNGVIQHQSQAVELTDYQKMVIKRIVEGPITSRTLMSTNNNVEFYIEASAMTDEELWGYLYRQLNQDFYQGENRKQDTIMTVKASEDYYYYFDKIDSLDKLKDMYGRAPENMPEENGLEIIDDMIKMCPADGEGVAISGIAGYKLENGNLVVDMPYEVCYNVEEYNTFGTAIVTFTPAPESFFGYTLESIDGGKGTLQLMRVVNCNQSITLRTSPSTNAEAVSMFGQIPLGATVSYIEPAENGFCKIAYNGDIGYALAAYLEFQ